MLGIPQMSEPLSEHSMNIFKAAVMVLIIQSRGKHGSIHLPVSFLLHINRIMSQTTEDKPRDVQWTLTGQLENLKWRKLIPK